MSLTPLIDVIFLLLLFFMLSSTFSKFGEIEIAATGGAAAASAKPPVFVQLLDNGVTVNGRSMARDAAVAELRRLALDGADAVVLSVRPGPTAQTLVDVMAAIRAVAGLRLTVIG